MTASAAAADFSMVVVGDTQSRWYMGHADDVKYAGQRLSTSIPAIGDLLRCFHPEGALWMVRDGSEPLKGIGGAYRGL